MELLYTIGAVLLLLIGAVYPLVAIFGLMKRLNRKPGPPPSPAQVMVRMVLIAAVPLAGILGGFAGLVPSVWESAVLRAVITVAGVVSLVGFAALAFLIAQDKPAGEGKSSLISKS